MHMVFKSPIRVAIVLFLWLYCLPLKSQKLSTNQYETLSREYALASIPELRAFLSIPNNALIEEHVENNLRFLERAFEKRRFWSF